MIIGLKGIPVKQGHLVKHYIERFGNRITRVRETDLL